MLTWSAEQVAEAAGAELLCHPSGKGGPAEVTIDSRRAGPGVLFVGLPGAHTDGGRYAEQAIGAGGWGVLVAAAHAAAATGAGTKAGAAVLCADDPLRALQRLAGAWRRHLGARVIGVTGSTGKTSTKDLLLAVLAPHRRTVASRANFNTEIGLPLELLAAPEGTEVLVLEMGMRGPGQIAELAAIAEPDVGVIVSIGPVHLELLGSEEAIAAAKAELVAGLPAGGTAVLPAGEPLLDPHLREDVRTVSFGEGGDVQLTGVGEGRVRISLHGEPVELEVDFTQAHLRRNLLAAVAAADAVGVRASGRVALRLSPGRGQRERLRHGVTLIDDCYNANPMSMRAALDELAATPVQGWRVAVLGDMLELGPDELRFHEEIGAYAAEQGVDLLVAVGPLARAVRASFTGELHLAPDAAAAAELVRGLVAPGDAVLVKASRGVGLEVVCQALRAAVRLTQPRRRA
jgi:UDP-N-acetylmuramoyl-tripeptide--D-alanyl-D-alanine ligase